MGKIDIERMSEETGIPKWEILSIIEELIRGDVIKGDPIIEVFDLLEKPEMVDFLDDALNALLEDTKPDNCLPDITEEDKGSLGKQLLDSLDNLEFDEDNEPDPEEVKQTLIKDYKESISESADRAEIIISLLGFYTIE